MSRWFRQCSMYLTGLLLLSATGCIHEEREVGSVRPKYGQVVRDRKFEKLRNANLALIPLGPRTMIAGKPGEIAIALKNNATKPVRIPEWRMNEADNVRLYCQPWLPGTEKPDEALWTCLDTEIKKPELRFNLELMPGNQAVVRRKLDFVENLVVSLGAERRYFLKAELNLTSAYCQTEVFAISITAR